MLCSRVTPFSKLPNNSEVNYFPVWYSCVHAFRDERIEMSGTATVERNDHKFVNELFGLGGNSTVYRPPPRDTVDVHDDGDYN